MAWPWPTERVNVPTLRHYTLNHVAACSLSLSSLFTSFHFHCEPNGSCSESTYSFSLQKRKHVSVEISIPIASRRSSRGSDAGDPMVFRVVIRQTSFFVAVYWPVSVTRLKKMMMSHSALDDEDALIQSISGHICN